MMQPMQRFLGIGLTRLLFTIGMISPRIELYLLGKIRSVLKKRARDFLLREGVLARIEKYAGGSTTTGCSYEDYRVLYQYVRRTRPIEVLECGTGVSTVVIAHALAKNEKETGVHGRITSMEELEEYYEMAQKLIPEDLSLYIDLVLSGTEEHRVGMLHGMKYASIPQREYDFVFVDGPNTYSPADGEATFDADVLAVLQTQKKPLTAMVDSRTATCTAFLYLFGPGKLSFDYLRGIGLLRGVTWTDRMDTKMIGARSMRRRVFRPDSAYSSPEA